VSASKRKGTSAESAVVDHLQAAGYPAERRALSGAKDRGDVAGVRTRIGRIVIEVKNCAQMALGAWVDEANVERDNDDAVIGAVWHKRRGKGSPLDWYVTMDGDTFLKLLDAASQFARENGAA
jgi:hypothetical protein